MMELSEHAVTSLQILKISLINYFLGYTCTKIEKNTKLFELVQNRIH